jgi:hypothetical protein
MQVYVHICTSMYAKFLKLCMHAPHAIPEVLTKWNNLLLYILVVIAFLSLVIIEFN